MRNDGGQKKKGGIKKIILIVIAVIVVIGVVGAIGGGSKKSDSKKVGTVGNASDASSTVSESNQSGENASAATASASSAVEIKDEYHVGDILQDGDVKIVYIASGEYKEDNQFMQPKDGNKFVFLQFAFENTGTKDQSISSFGFEAYADGYNVEQHYGNEDQIDASLSGGRSCSGRVVFEVPAEAKEIEIEYKSNIFLDDKIKFIYDGEKSSGYVVENNAEASADAYKPGDVIETKDLKISYLSCNLDYNSGNQFITPKEGNKFIQCELEFENIGDSDTSVSVFSFKCYADGAACDASYTDSDISATISAGRKASGTVTFEVPIDAKVIEIEYETNVWTSERIVLSVE